MVKYAVLIFLFSLWSMRSLFHPGLMYTHDSLWHVERLQVMMTDIAHQFPVRWSPSLDHGYGIPLFNFTYPLPYYLGMIPMLFGLGPVATYNLLLFTSYLLGGLGVLVLGKSKPVYGLVAAILYLLSPYWFLDIFVRGALGEVMALGLIPWVFVAYAQLSRTGKLAWWMPIPLALLFLSHNFYGYLFGAVMLFFILILYRHKRLCLYILIHSLALAAFFLLPAYMEKSSLLISQQGSAGYLEHFAYPLQLIYGEWSYAGSQIGQGNEMSFQLGLANIVLLLSAIFYASLQGKRLGKVSLWYLVTTLAALGMTLPLSKVIWSFVPLLPSLQFPWRFLGISTALLPLIYLELSSRISDKLSKHFIFFGFALIAIALFNTRGYHQPLKWLNESEFMALHYIYSNKTTTAHRAELVPRWAPDERPMTESAPIFASLAQIKNVRSESGEINFTASANTDNTWAIYSQNYFPIFRATIDGDPLKISPTESGEIKVPLLVGDHDYQIKLASTRVQKLGNLVSLLGILALFCIPPYTRKKDEQKPRP